MLYRIAWKDPGTGKIEHGIALFEKDQAQQIANELNRRWANTEFLHWIEAVSDDKEPIDTP